MPTPAALGRELVLEFDRSPEALAKRPGEVKTVLLF